MQVFNGQQANMLSSAMQLLPVNQKLVVELKFFQHCTFDDNAQQLGFSVNTVMSRFYSALDKLIGHLELEHVK
jgi:RNA polymerase sigma-70 factor (ECF subfamily)